MAKKKVPTDAEIMDYRNVKVAVAADYLGQSPEIVRRALRQGRAPYGYGIHNEETDTWEFHISPGLLVGYRNGSLRSLSECGLVTEIVEEVERLFAARSRAALEILAPGTAKKEKGGAT